MIAGYKITNPHTKQPTGFVEKIKNGTKIHTIRRGDRWSKAFDRSKDNGQLLIQHSTGVRTKAFKTVFVHRVVSVQRFEILMNEQKDAVVAIKIDGRDVKNFNKDFPDQFAKNDGFESWNDLADWFGEDITVKGDFIGEIIHWTDLKY